MSAPDTGRRLMIAAAAVVAATLVAAVLVMDPPSRQRAERLDRKRVADLQLLSQRIDVHAGVHDRLPERLAVVDRGAGRTIVDPATGRPYEYAVTGERRYRLCATFATEAARPDAVLPEQDAWRHAAGRQCFDRRVGETAIPALPAHPR